MPFFHKLSVLVANKNSPTLIPLTKWERAECFNKRKFGKFWLHCHVQIQGVVTQVIMGPNHLFPALLFLGMSSGLGRALTCLTGGGSCSLSSFFCTSSRRPGHRKYILQQHRETHCTTMHATQKFCEKCSQVATSELHDDYR